MERQDKERLQRLIDREVKARLGAGTVRGVALLQHGDDPVIEPGELLVRVFIATEGGPADDRRSLDEWAQAHQAGMRQIRRELSLRLPPARLLEFTVNGASDTSAAARITMPDDPALTAEPLPARELVEAALVLLRSSYVFPDRAEQAATAIEARLAAGEYDGLDEESLAERLTAQLSEACADKHLRVQMMPPLAVRREPAGPADRQEPGGPGPGPGPGPGGGSGGTRATTAFSASSGWRATSAIWTCAGSLTRQTPARPSPRRWNSSPERMRSSSTCGATTAAPRTGWPSGAATCSPAEIPTSATSSTPTPGKPPSSGPWPTCRAPAISTGRSTC